ISVVGGAVASVVVIGITVVMANASARRGWDLDNVAAPIVTAAGDLVTLPSIWLAAHLVDLGWFTGAVGAVCAAAAVAAVVSGMRTSMATLRGIVRQSLPILAVAGLVSVAAGVSIEKRLESFIAFPALLMLIPPFLATAGAIGGIFSSRLATKLHLGLIDPSRFRLLAVAEDMFLVVLFAFPVFLAVGVVADILGAAVGLASPGAIEMVEIALIAGVLATASLVVIGYLGTVTAYRFGLDPDNYAIPVVTSSLDLLGAFSVIFALVAVGVA
ncbi:MAG TPA: magnesium transporter, partial [Acidimicrobiia bacterium]|nr:magnesium transporter [Acidimicrobiia bacterium]